MGTIPEAASPGYECPVCSFRVWLPLAELSVSLLGLYDDARYPGRCILVLKEHAEDFASLPSRLTVPFVDDAQRAARTIRKATKATLMNYAILGNAEPHIHVHLIPRVSGGDPVPRQSPWSTPLEKRPLDDARRLAISASILAALPIEAPHSRALI
jgi:diadenosine tetraphosphate (Ap4A) HIT family hydrolase